MERKRVAVIGSGNWGSTLAKLIAQNVLKDPAKYVPEVRMWVYEEKVDGRNLTEIINEQHENVKYLPGVKFTDNLVAIPSVREAAKDADLLMFVLPHQFVENVCKQLKGVIKSQAVVCSAIKGLHNSQTSSLELISSLISSNLGVETGVLMGANIAKEVAGGNFCETTIGFKNPENGKVWKELVQTENFRVVVVNEVETVELCGALKNIVAFGAGIVDGLYSDSGQSNTKAAIIRLGLMEIIKFCEEFHPGGRRDIFLESCGVADMITSSFGGRNRMCGEHFARDPSKSLSHYEETLLNG